MRIMSYNIQVNYPSEHHAHPKYLQAPRIYFDKQLYSKAVENVGYTVGAVVFKKILENIIMVLAYKTGIIPSIDWDQMMHELCIQVNNSDNFYQNACVVAPIFEEPLFRYGIQEVLLTYLPKKIVKKVAPGKEMILDCKIAKTSRIALTTLLFAAIHLINKSEFPESYVMRQVISSFVGGIIFGILKESRVGLLGAIEAHCLNNCLSALLISRYCTSRDFNGL